MNKPPISVTAHSGIDSQNPQSSMASIMLCGNAVEDELAIPEAVIIHDDLALELKEYLECLGPIDPKARIFPVSKSGMHHEMERGCKLSGVVKL